MIDISTYTVPVIISPDDFSESFIAVQISSNSALDSSVTVKFQQASDGLLIDIANTTNVIASGENTVLIETFDFTLSTLYLHIDVGSATAGELSISASPKKKDDDNVNATIEGVVVVDNPETQTVKELLRNILSIQKEQLLEQRINNKILMESGYAEITKSDIKQL